MTNNNVQQIKTRYWASEISEIAQVLSTSVKNGLTTEDVGKRLIEYGPNQLKETKSVSPLEILLEQFKDLIIWILIGAALVSGLLLKEWIDAGAIIAIVIINAILGFVQEYKAEKSIAALKKLASPMSKVVRDSKLQSIPSQDIVPGDIVELESGDNVPADARVISLSSNFATLEASLTGESTPINKTNLLLEEKELSIGDRANAVYMGTSVAAGKARVLVFSTGMNTELGKIAGMIQDIERVRTPLQKRLEEFGKWIVYIAFALVGLIFLFEILRGGKLIDVFLTAVSLAVAAIPEGLPAVVTIALALGVQRMVKRHALIRKLPSVETLGSATVVCSDKTGTLTKNEMTVTEIFSLEGHFSLSGTGYNTNGDFAFVTKNMNSKDIGSLVKTLHISALCNNSEIEPADGKNYKIVGDPTEAALLIACAKANIFKKELMKEYAVVEELPFDSERKKMSVVLRSSEGTFVFTKGAPDVLLKDCTKVLIGKSERPMTEIDRKKIQFENDAYSNNALRVLGFAYRKLDNPGSTSQKEVERDLVFAGLMAMIDPPRPEVKVAIANCKKAGIRTIMITGDHKNTAVAIARELGIYGEGSSAVSGEELDQMDDQTFAAMVKNVPVYARVSPSHKLRIVKTLKDSGEIVAMTGDGVNDAPALKEANIGIAMGITGTDVTKEVSDMIVTDDNFASIAAAIEEGRGIYDNINKFIHYLLSCNAGEILVMFIPAVIGLPVPLLPIHILWVNLVTDGLPALALGIDPVDPGIMNRLPRKPDEAIVNTQRALTMLYQGSFIAVCSLGAFMWVLMFEKGSVETARSAAFIVLSCSQLFHAFNCRNQNISLFKIGILTNKKLIAATLISFTLQLAVVYVPFLQGIFKTASLTAYDWVLVLALSSLPLWFMEIVKLFKGNKHAAA